MVGQKNGFFPPLRVGKAGFFMTDLKSGREVLGVEVLFNNREFLVEAEVAIENRSTHGIGTVQLWVC